MNTELRLNSLRVRKARLQHHIGAGGYDGMRLGVLAAAIGGTYCLLIGELPRLGFGLLGLALLLLMLVMWYRYDISSNQPRLPARTLDDIIAPVLLARLRQPITPQSVWNAALREPAGRFICNRLAIDAAIIRELLGTDAVRMNVVWQEAITLLDQNQTAVPQLHGGTAMAAILLSSPAGRDYLTQLHLNPEDVTEVYTWLNRQLAYIARPRAYFGGVGRDWASGFTPYLERYGQNISHAIETWGGYGRYASHADILGSVATNLARDMAVALVGPAGVGKTELVFALADRLLEGAAPDLQYYQIISLDASAILATSQGNIERLMTILFGEAIAAGNIILYLDEAQLFFGHGVGAFDMSQLLLPVLKNKALKIVTSFTPGDWQRLKAANESLSASFAPVILHEPEADAIMKVVEDSAILLEIRQQNILITYQAIREAYRLSGQYMQEDAYPGKAIVLLEQAVPFIQNQIMGAETVQAAVEKMRGVRVSAAQAPEADMLLHLEDRIHQRMINQKQAVDVVAAALRRSRAGVSSPKRPVGSFLFLGPTGVGKTELARSLAAVYFGDEQQMIRLDMSEYQSPEDVSRLLQGGNQEGNNQNLLTTIRQQPFSVVLLDEVEKAHPNILNLLLQMFDEGQLTDEQGKPASFRSAIIIATSNAGATDIIAKVREGHSLDETFERNLLDKLISIGTFKPELINRFDEVVLFRPLNQSEIGQVAQLMLEEVNHTLARQNIQVVLTPAALETIVKAGYDPEFGARPLRRVIQKTVEDAVAVKILQKQAQAGSIITLDAPDLAIRAQHGDQAL
ncbi:MAG TPA: AAA family ATPase [Candidatus Saccharimonadales bacterium]|nr:AAA family ATPase [Candidatus Saccharimonadales bacterium]